MSFTEPRLCALVAMVRRITWKFSFGIPKESARGPETEALGRPSTDMPRYMSGAVHLASKPFYSIETSAELGNAYGQTLQDIVWWSKRAWAGGVKIQHLHGESYSGQFEGAGSISGVLPGQTWPSYSAFANRWSNNWVRQTSKDALIQTLIYMARMNYILQKKAKVDLAIYDDSPDIYDNPSVPRGDGHAVYADQGILESHGFSYDFVSPGLLALPQVTVSRGMLAVYGPAYKALVVHNQTAMTPKTLEHLIELAHAGLRIVFVGTLPSRNASHSANIRQKSESLLKLPTVKRVAEYSEVPEALRLLGCRPDAEPDTPTGVLTQHRVDAAGDFYYLYNYNKVSDTDVSSSGASKQHTKYPNIDKPANFVAKSAQFSFAGTGRPYVLDPWSGTIKPIPQYESKGGHLRIPVQLAGDQAVLIAVMTDRQARRQGLKLVRAHAVDIAHDMSQNLTYDRDGGLTFRASLERDDTFRLADGNIMRIPAGAVQLGQAIQDWSLTVQAIEAPVGGSLFKDSTWREVGPFKLGTKLRGWKEIDPSLERVLGIGEYTGSFQLEKGPDAGGGAYLELGSTDDFVSVSINGNLLPPQDSTVSLIDIGPFTRSGRNILAVRVATTIYNRVVSGTKGYGLLGKDGVVRIVPYRLVPVVLRYPSGKRAQ